MDSTIDTLRAILEAVPHPGGLEVLAGLEQHIEEARSYGIGNLDRAHAAERDARACAEERDEAKAELLRIRKVLDGDLVAAAPRGMAHEVEALKDQVKELSASDHARFMQALENGQSAHMWKARAARLQDVLEKLLSDEIGRGDAIDALSTLASVSAGSLITKAAQDVLAERRRQVEAEGWTMAHDDEHVQGEMAAAAASYAYASRHAQRFSMFPEPPPMPWPWAVKFWKPSSPRQMLVKAGALILAEIERIDRAEAREVKP